MSPNEPPNTMAKRLNNRKRSNRGKRGVSTIFLTIYITMLSMILISALFVGAEIYGYSTTSYLKNEQERNQEEISLDGFERTLGRTIESISITNTGTITVRIRGLYIDGQFICDPSTLRDAITLEYQDTYIGAKQTKSVKVPYILLDMSNLNAEWTIATERGTKSSEMGYELIGGGGGQGEDLYIGPLRIRFSQFFWRSSLEPPNVWENGWKIPKGVSGDISWCILVQNVDTQNRDMVISPLSFLTLICNDNNPGADLYWYAHPADANKPLKPGIWTFFTFSINPTGQKPNAEDRTNLCFLLVTGAFDDGSTFGQTIPFEAVLITSRATMNITASPRLISPKSESKIEVTMTDNDGPLSNVLVSFTKDPSIVGTLSSPIASTDQNGKATVIFTAGPNTGDVKITAVSMAETASITISVR